MKNKYNMKKIILILMGLWLSISLFAQKPDFINIFNKYENIQGVSAVSISPGLVFSSSKSNGNNNTSQIVKQLKLLKILTISIKNESDKVLSRKLIKEVTNYISSHEMNELMHVKDENNEIVTIYNSLHELIFLILDEDETSVIYLQGNISKTVTDAVLDGTISIN